jgi:acetolactate synthase regulatory subunit
VTPDPPIDASVQWLAEPPTDLVAPVLVTMLSGWIDAGTAAKAAVDVLAEQFGASPIAELDDDVYVDFRARRPIMELRDGLNSVLQWEQIVVHHGRDHAGTDVLLLTGPEPDMAWHRFVRSIGQIAGALGVRSMFHLGAYPFATPHTRPARISISTPSQDVLASVPYLRSSVDVPAGVAAAIEHEMHGRGIRALGIWAQVPHYVASMSYPAATAALLEALAEVSGLSIATSTVEAETAVQRRRIDALVAGNDDHQAMVSQLERIYDAEHADNATWLAGPPLEMRSAEEIAAEVEEFLRRQE